MRVYPYVYGDSNWKDKLTSFDGHTITYDAIGNPLTDGTWTYVWEAGRLLKSMSKVEDGNTITMEFTYNYAGLRTKKIKKVNGEVTETTECLMNGKQVVGLKKGTDELKFYYDAQGRVAMVDFNGTKYAYVHNLQGDIIAIVDSNGVCVVEYKYDAWGKPLESVICTIGELNPFKYRGYVWDEETQLFYLRNRYYTPYMVRFISIDRFTNGNIHKYSKNNPVTSYDPSGNEEELSDITQKVDEVVKANIDEFLSHNVNGVKDPSFSNMLSHVKDYYWFYQQVNHEAKWDVKVPDR